MGFGRVSLGFFALCFFLFSAGVSRADVAAAEALFREGRRLIAEGKIREACGKFAESQRQDPSSGTLINLATCHADLGMTATAWAEFLAAARMAYVQRRPDRAAEAERRAGDLKPKLSYITVVVAEKLPGLTVTRNETPLSASAIGVQLPVDPGEQRLQVTAPGYEAFSVTVTIREPAQHEVINVPRLVPKRKKPALEPVLASPPRATTAPTPRRAPANAPKPPINDRTPGRSLPASFWVAGGTSLLSAGVGTTFGLLSLSSYGEAEDFCESHQNCNADTIAADDRANTQANIANVAFGTALVAAVVTGILYFTADDSGPAAQGEFGTARNP